MRWICGLLVILFTSQARADTVTVTFSGTVAPYVWTGSSYVTGNPLAGDSFSSVWTLDACPGCNSGVVQSVSLAIGNQTISYALGSYMSASITSTQIYLNDTVAPGSVALNSFVQTRQPLFPDAITTSFTYQTVADDNFSYPFHLGGSFWSDGPDGYLQVASLTVDNPSYIGQPFFVPGPVLGFGVANLFLLGLLWRFR